MSHTSVTDGSETINPHTFTEIVLKLEVLAYFSLTEAFSEAPSFIQHDYLWLMQDLITSLTALNH